MSFSLSVKTYLKFGGSETSVKFVLKSVTYAAGASILDDSSGISAFVEDGVESVHKGAVVDKTCAVLGLITVEQLSSLSLSQVDIKCTDASAEL